MPMPCCYIAYFATHRQRNDLHKNLASSKVQGEYYNVNRKWIAIKEKVNRLSHGNFKISALSLVLEEPLLHSNEWLFTCALFYNMHYTLGGVQSNAQIP